MASRPPLARGREPGQVLVLFAMSMVVIMAAAGLAFDIGRFYSEKRFLQNAADAGALAVANALIRGETNTDAEAEGRDVLTRNLIGSPTGTPGVGRDDARVRDRPHGRGRSTSPAASSSPVARSASRSRAMSGYTFGRVVGLGIEPGRRSRPGRRPSATCCRSPCGTTSTPPDRSPARSPRAMGTPTSSRTWSRPRTRPASAARPTARCASTPNPGNAVQRVGAGRRPGQPRTDHRAGRPGRVAIERRELPWLRRPRHPQLPVRLAAVERVLQRRDGRHERQHAQGDGGRLGRHRLSGSRLPARHDAARPERPGRHHRRQLVGHRRRRHQRPLRPRGRDPRRGLFGHGLEHPGLQLRGPEHGDDQHEPEPQRLDHDERDEERLVHGRRVDQRLPELGRDRPIRGARRSRRCRSARAR